MATGGNGVGRGPAPAFSVGCSALRCRLRVSQCLPGQSRCHGADGRSTQGMSAGRGVPGQSGTGPPVPTKKRGVGRSPWGRGASRDVSCLSPGQSPAFQIGRDSAASPTTKRTRAHGLEIRMKLERPGVSGQRALYPRRSPQRQATRTWGSDRMIIMFASFVAC